jgi:hypothetical protein
VGSGAAGTCSPADLALADLALADLALADLALAVGASLGR